MHFGDSYNLLDVRDWISKEVEGLEILEHSGLTTYHAGMLGWALQSSLSGFMSFLAAAEQNEMFCKQGIDPHSVLEDDLADIIDDPELLRQPVLDLLTGCCFHVMALDHFGFLDIEHYLDGEDIRATNEDNSFFGEMSANIESVSYDQIGLTLLSNSIGFTGSSVTVDAEQIEKRCLYAFYALVHTYEGGEWYGGTHASSVLGQIDDPFPYLYGDKLADAQDLVDSYANEVCS